MTVATSDVCVVGGGPAGVAAAVAAARGGLQVVLVDRGQFPRPKVCGGCLNGRALAILDRLGLTNTLAHATSTSQFRLGYLGRSTTVGLPTGAALSRLAWDVAMLDAAAEAGVTVCTGTTATLEPCSDSAAVRSLTLTHNQHETTHRTRVVVAADGLTQSATRAERTLRTHLVDGSRIGAGCLLNEDSDDYPAGCIHIATANEGYVGLVRVEANRLNVAAALDPAAVRSGSLANATAGILQAAGWPVPTNWQTADWTGTPPLTRSTPAPVAWRVATIGDAAGYVEPFTGEGMAWALASGEALGTRLPDWIRTPTAMQTNWPGVYRDVVSRRRTVCRALAYTLRRPRLCRAVFPLAGLLVKPATHLMNRH